MQRHFGWEEATWFEVSTITLDYSAIGFITQIFVTSNFPASNSTSEQDDDPVMCHRIAEAALERQRRLGALSFGEKRRVMGEQIERINITW